jgi:hypothetical protein
MGENFLNRGYIGIDERISVGGLLTPKTDYLDKVENARFIEFDFTTLKYSSPIYVNRRGSGSYLDADGWIVSNSNDLRIDHSYTGYTYGLLIEEQRTNFFSASEEFNLRFVGNFAGWTANAGETLLGTINGTTGLDKTFTADRAVPSTGYGAKTNNMGGAANSPTYCSLYAKAAELTKLYYGDQANGRFQLRFGVTAGDLIFSSLAVPSQQYISIERTRDDWFRIGVNNDLVGGLAWTPMPYPDGATIFSAYQPTFGNCAGFGMWFWGAQLENINIGRAYPTSYIRVIPASVGQPQINSATRTQDEITISGTGPTNTIWLKEPGSLYVEYYRREGKGASAHTVISTDNVSQRFICIEHIPSGNTGTLRWGTNSLSLTGGVTGLNKAAFTINGVSGSTVQFAFNGRISGTTATNLVPANIQWLTLGAKSTSINSGFSDYFNSSIAKIRYYPRVLTSSELQEITKNA